MPAVTRPQQAQHHSDRLLGLAEAANGTATTSPAVHAVVVAYAGAPYRETLNRIQVTFKGTLTNCGRPHVGGRVLDVAVGSNRTVGGIRLDCGKYAYPSGGRVAPAGRFAGGTGGQWRIQTSRDTAGECRSHLGAARGDWYSRSRQTGRKGDVVRASAWRPPRGDRASLFRRVVWNQVVRGLERMATGVRDTASELHGCLTARGT